MENQQENKKINWLNGLIAFTVLGALVWISCNLKSCSENNLKANKQCTEGATDTIEKLVYQTKWNTITNDRFLPGVTHTMVIPANVDTMEILKQYFSHYSSHDTIKDKDLLGILYFTISENKMLRDSFVYKILRPDVETIISHTIVPKTKNSFFLGFNTGVQTSLKNFGFGPEVYFVSKKQKAFGLGYDVMNKTISGKFLIKL